MHPSVIIGEPSNKSSQYRRLPGTVRADEDGEWPELERRIANATEVLEADRSDHFVGA
jgi:hypothetical protein